MTNCNFAGITLLKANLVHLKCFMIKQNLADKARKPYELAGIVRWGEATCNRNTSSPGYMM